MRRVSDLDDRDALSTVKVAVFPLEPINLFGRSCGIDGIDRAFELFDRGTTESIDVAFGDGRPFVSTCLAGSPRRRTRPSRPD